MYTKRFTYSLFFTVNISEAKVVPLDEIKRSADLIDHLLTAR